MTGKDALIDRIEWLGHASWRLNGGGDHAVDDSPVIYIDPWRVARGSQTADVILLTHDHYDHCSPADIDKIRAPHTIVVGNQMVSALVNDVKVLLPYQVINIGRASIRAVPAFNSHHPREFSALGFVISMDHHDIYYAGDTDLIPEMSNIRCDVAILPIGGRQTMDARAAVEATRQIRPRWALPSHWGVASEGGSLMDVRAFTQGASAYTEVVTPAKPR